MTHASMQCVGVVQLVPVVRSVMCTGDSVTALTSWMVSLVSRGDGVTCVHFSLTSQLVDVQVGGCCMQ